MSRPPPFVSVGFGFLLPRAPSPAVQAAVKAAPVPCPPTAATDETDQKPSLAPDLSLLYKSRLIRAPSRKLPLLYSSSALPTGGRGPGPSPLHALRRRPRATTTTPL